MMRQISWAFALITAAVSAQSPQGYYRFPALYGETVVFSAEGDLWRVGTGGGLAQRLTTHPGSESHAAISPDGQTIAFSAEYEGPTEVYTMPLNGGLPQRHTFEGGTALVAGWTSDGRILYRTTAFSTLPNAQLVSLDPKSGDRRLLPLAQAAEGVFEPENKTLFFTWFAKQSSSTKRYQGGWVENLWRYTSGDLEAIPLATDFSGTSRTPMWWRGRVYFVSDRDGIMNLWSMKPDGTDLRQLTKQTGYDIKGAALQNGRIIYSRGADLHLFDLARAADRVLNITLVSDLDQQREKWISRPLDYLTATHLSPTGDRLVLTARGQIFVAPLTPGRFVALPRSPGVRYREARFLPDGKSLVAQTDETGEIEFLKMPANGLGPREWLTTNGTVFRFAAVPSPDGKRLAWSDHDQKFWVLNQESHTTDLVDESRADAISDFQWSPDSQWLAYVKEASNTYPQIYLYGLANGTRLEATSDRVGSFSPAWSPDGQWLYFLSDRDLRSLVSSPWGARQPEPFFTETTKLYALSLKPGVRWPFAVPDELGPEEAVNSSSPETATRSKHTQVETDQNVETKSSAKIEPRSSPTNLTGDVKVVIEPKELASRIYEVPVPAGNYSELNVTAKYLFWLARDTGFDAKPQLKQVEITSQDPKPKLLVENITSYEKSANGKKLLVRKGTNFFVVASDTAAPAKLEDAFDLSGWTLSLVPREEWRQIYTESWRMLRDYFYDRKLHEVDWLAVHKKYLPLVDRVSDREELNDVISEMAGELSALHIYVRFGDDRNGPDQIKTASLGAQLRRDEGSGGWRIEHIFQADPDYPRALSPLARPGIELRDNDVITSINGRPLLDVLHPEAFLRNQAGKQVLLAVNSGANTTNRLVVVNPITPEQEAELRYDEWEFTRRKAVDQLSSNQIGYVHLRAMGTDNIAEWAREFYPVFKRQALIIDVRHNRGGNIDSWILSKLLRKAWFYWQPRVGDPIWNMQYAFRGHVTVLCDERTASDGEAFAEGFKRLGLGQVIGTRTWGGEIWLSARRWLVDSGMASAAETGVYGPDGEWLIEGHGVDPNLVVDNLPHATFAGRDQQLETAVKHLQELMAKDPRPIPTAPPYPNKRFPKAP